MFGGSQQQEQVFNFTGLDAMAVGFAQVTPIAAAPSF